MQEQRIVTIRLGMLGFEDEGHGTAVVLIDTEADFGRPLANACRKALAGAMTELAVKITRNATDD